MKNKITAPKFSKGLQNSDWVIYDLCRGRGEKAYFIDAIEWYLLSSFYILSNGMHKLNLLDRSMSLCLPVTCRLMFYLLVVGKFFFNFALFVVTVHNFCLVNFTFSPLQHLFWSGHCRKHLEGGMRKNLWQKSMKAAETQGNPGGGLVPQADMSHDCRDFRLNSVQLFCCTFSSWQEFFKYKIIKLENKIIMYKLCLIVSLCSSTLLEVIQLLSFSLTQDYQKKPSRSWNSARVLCVPVEVFKQFDSSQAFRCLWNVQAQQQ